MKIALIIAVALSAALTFPTHAQTAQADSRAVSQQQSTVDARVQGNQLGVTQVYNSDGAAHYSGSAQILSNPGVILGGAAAGFSNNNCANTMQGGLSGLKASIGVAAPKESRACNFRQNASTFYAAAAEEQRQGLYDRAAALRSMGVVAACRAAAELDATDMDNCRALGLVLGRESARKFEPVAQPQRATQPGTPAAQFPTGSVSRVERASVVQRP